MKRTVIYLSTRDRYKHVMTSMKSLLYYNDIDKIYLLIENRVFPYTLPKNAECINIKNNLEFLTKNCPNAKSKWGPSVLLKPALCHILPDDVETALYLDSDTIVLGNIEALFELPLEDHYFAGVAEPKKTRKDFLYTNAGVLLLNLKKMRDGKADQIIQLLNTTEFEAVEQDAMNIACQGSILEMPPEYNVSYFTKQACPPLIRHFAAEGNWFLDPLVTCWEDIYLDEIFELKSKGGNKNGNS